MIVCKHSLVMILIFFLTVVVVLAVIEDDNITKSCKPEDAQISSDGPCLSCELCYSNEMMCCKEIDCTGSCYHLVSDGMVWHHPQYVICDATSCGPPITVCCPPECDSYRYDENLCTGCKYHDACPVPSIILAPVYSNPLNQSQPEDGNDSDNNSGKNNTPSSNNTNVIDSSTATPIDVRDKLEDRTSIDSSSLSSSNGGLIGGVVGGAVFIFLITGVGAFCFFKRRENPSQQTSKASHDPTPSNLNQIQVQPRPKLEVVTGKELPDYKAQVRSDPVIVIAKVVPLDH